MARLVVTLAATLVLVTGCKEFNREACVKPENQNDPRCLIDAPAVMCDTTCPGTDVCLNHVCVQCTAAQHDACGGVTPACDDTTHTCVGCTSHDQCVSSSDVCAPEGNCADEKDVAYVATGGDDVNTCTKTSKCKTMTRALTQVTSTRRYIKIEDQANDTTTTTINSQNVTILAEPTASMHNSSMSPILSVTGSSQVRIFDLTLENATGGVGQANAITMPSGTGTLELVRVTVFNNTSTGIVVTGGTKLTMNRCVVVRNSIVSGDGGISVFNVDFDITNSVFASNGGTASVSGAAFLKPLTAAAKFEFNTVANNTSMSGAIGVNCVVPMALANNIVTGNALTPGCASTFSLFDAGPPLGNGNLAGAADFKNTNFNNPHAADFFRLNDGSLAKDRADPATNMKVDIDGDSRPQGDHADIGADEIRKPAL